MTSTPSNRLKVTPSNSPFLSRPSRSPIRSRPVNSSPFDARLSLKRVVGTTCSSPTGFDTVDSSFAYIAGGAVVVVDVEGEHYSQRFYRARPTAVPVYSVSLQAHNSQTTPNSTPKANDSRNRVALSQRDSFYPSNDWSESPSTKTWTSRERIKAATCLALNKDARFLAVGETGYSPRVLIFNLQDSSSDVPLVSISEHAFGVKAVAWSPDTRYLASLGAANDGFLYVWKIDPRTGAAKLFQQNRCTASVKGMVWMGNGSLVTFGVRHIKVWRIEEPPAISPLKAKFLQDSTALVPQPQKALPGRNILLGSLLDAIFSCVAVVDDTTAIACSESGDVCVYDDADKQMKLTRLMGLPFGVSCITVREGRAFVSGKAGQFATLNVDALLGASADCIISTAKVSPGLLAMGFLSENLVTIDSKRSIDIWSPDYVPGQSGTNPTCIPIPGHGDPILGVQALSKPNDMGASYFTWSGGGKITLWDLDGRIKSKFTIPVECPSQITQSDSEFINQLTIVRATPGGKQFIAGDKLGILKVFDCATNECLSETKAHSSDCNSITIHEDEAKCLMVSSGRDRTAQLFQRAADGSFEHFQTLEFQSKVVQLLIPPTGDKLLTCSLDRTLQVHDLVCKDGDPNMMAAIASRTIPLKASPTSMTVASDGKSILVSLLDRSVALCDISIGRQINSFKCTDEGGIESVVLDSLVVGQSHTAESPFLLAVSNTDKSVRLYDAFSGAFVDREWGHTESINGVTLVEDEDSNSRKVVSVGSDGTLMVWSMDPPEPQGASSSRDTSPAKDLSASTRPPLRRVLSRAELAEFQRPPQSSGRKSPPPRTLQKRPSKYSLTTSAFRTPVQAAQTSPTSAIPEDTPSRRTSSGSRSGSPPISPKAKVTRRPSLPALSGAARKRSTGNLRGFGTVNMATEQATRTLRSYRKKLSGTETINQELLSELDQELRLTIAALGDRALRSKALNESLVSGLLDQYSERLFSMIDERLRLSSRGRSRSRGNKEHNRSRSPSRRRSCSRDGDSDRDLDSVTLGGSRDGDIPAEDKQQQQQKQRPKSAEVKSTRTPKSPLIR